MGRDALHDGVGLGVALFEEGEDAWGGVEVALKEAGDEVFHGLRVAEGGSPFDRLRVNGGGAGVRG